MEYSGEQVELIKYAFKKVRKEFDDELKIENDADVLKALKLFRSRFNMGDQWIPIMKDSDHPNSVTAKIRPRRS